MFFIRCDAIFLVRLQGKFEIDHSWDEKFKCLYLWPKSVGFQFQTPSWVESFDRGPLSSSLYSVNVGYDSCWWMSFC